MDKNLIKPFTITSLGMAAGLVMMKVFNHQANKQKSELEAKEKEKKLEIVSEQLTKLNAARDAEIKKNGKASETTLRLIDELVKKL